MASLVSQYCEGVIKRLLNISGIRVMSAGTWNQVAAQEKKYKH